MSDGLKIVARSQTQDVAAFQQMFAEIPDRVRQDPYRLGLLPASIWLGFLQMPVPFPAEFWIAEIEGRPVGRIGANRSTIYQPYAYMGFLEVDVSHPQADAIATGLLKTCLAWARSHGVEKLLGPLTFNTWFPYRYRVDSGNAAFESLRFTWEPVHPPEYVRYLSQSGFTVVEGYHSQGLDGLQAFADSTEPAYRSALENGYTFRGFDSSRILDREVPILYRLSLDGFKKNFLFEPIPFESFQQLYVPIAEKMDVSYAHWAVDPSGKEVGFFFCYADQGYVVYKSVAVDPSARGQGLSNALAFLAAQTGLRNGVSKLITALVKSGAQSESYAKKAAALWKHEYALFERRV